jgi:hypothetical protein
MRVISKTKKNETFISFFFVFKYYIIVIFFKSINYLFMKKVAILSFMILLLSSCMKIDYDLYISKDMMMDGTITMDLSKINALTQSMQDSF